MTCAQLDRVLARPPAHCVEGETYWMPPVTRQARASLAGATALAVQLSGDATVTTSSARQLGAPQPGTPQPDASASGSATGLMSVPPPRDVLDADPNPDIFADLVITGDAATRLQASHQPQFRDMYLVATDGGRQAMNAVDSAAAGFDPRLVVSQPDVNLSAGYQLPLYSVLLEAGTAVTLLIAFASVAVTTVDRAAERRREVAMQTASGVPLTTMRGAQLVQILVPYGAGVVLAVVAGILGGRGYSATVGVPFHLPARDLWGVTVLVLLGAAVAAGSTLPGLNQGIRVEYLRRE
jgi:hypothetical protein